MKNGFMSLVNIDKSALTGIHDKMIVLENMSCCPFLYNVPESNYIAR
jgi:hypothetical protein